MTNLDVEFFSLLRRRRSSGSRKQGYEEEKEGDDDEAFGRSESENSCDGGQQEQGEYEIADPMSSSSKRHREEEEGEKEKEEAHGRGGHEFEERSKLLLAPHSVLLAVGLHQQQSADDEDEQEEGDEEEQAQEEALLSQKSFVQLHSRITMTTGKQVDRRRKELKSLRHCSAAFLEPSLLACSRHRGGSSQIFISGDKEEDADDAFQQLPLQQQVKTVLAKKMIERGARSIFLRSTYHAQEALLRRGNGEL
jgi:hypothetical protein